MPSGSATAVTAAEDVPSAATNATKPATTAPRMRFARTAILALTVSEARGITAKHVSYVNSVRITYVNAAGAAANVY